MDDVKVVIDTFYETFEGAEEYEFRMKLREYARKRRNW